MKYNAVEIIEPTSCSIRCSYEMGNYDKYKINVISLTLDQKDWIVSGKGSFPENIECMWCGRIYEAVKKIVPIQVDTITCNTCGSGKNLKFNVTNLVKDRNSFEFIAIVSCEKCKKTETLKNIFSKLLSRIKIEYRVAGISIIGEK